MTPLIYTAITFAPVQGFIEKSRKLRDLYGSSYILSALSWSICTAATGEGHTVISPAAPNLTQGMPNQIIIAGDFSQKTAQQAFNRFWRSLLYTCRDYIQATVPADYKWEREWKLWAEHAWEFFHATGPDIPNARQQLNDAKQQRAWTGINWTGESSTLSGADAIAWPQMGFHSPRTASRQSQQQSINYFYTALRNAIGEPFIDPTEELSIPELVKRIITREDVAKAVARDLKKYKVVNLDTAAAEQLTAIARQLNPKSFVDLNRLKRKNPDIPLAKEHWTGWFLGDGDKAGDYLKQNPNEINAFSAQMREWGRAMVANSNDYAIPNTSVSNYLAGDGRMIYAGGDDFMGVLYKKDQQIDPKDCFEAMGKFNQNLWQGECLKPTASIPFEAQGNRPKPITASVGFVWAAPHVPQRDVLQHCHAAEQSAKTGGRNRIAFRILFNGGNHLEWVCPWWILEAGHININNNQLGLEEKQAWTHLYNDIATLESRHAFGAQQNSNTDIAQHIFGIYFGQNNPSLSPTHWWNTEDKTNLKTGILGNQSRYKITNQQDPEHSLPIDENRFVKEALNTWIINLAKAGFHLARPLSA